MLPRHWLHIPNSDRRMRISPRPRSEYGIFPNLYNVNEETFTFLENILTEVMRLFPSTYIHVGGDEAVKDQWKASPQIQAQMKALGIKDEDQLQSYFIKRIDTFLTAHGRRTLGWDEIWRAASHPMRQSCRGAACRAVLPLRSRATTLF